MPGSPQPLGLARTAGWAPVQDPARSLGLGLSAVFDAARHWTPFGVNLLSHQLTVNIPTGALTVSTSDLQIPYFGLSFAVVRTCNTQEQAAEAFYRLGAPNTDPRFHFFANWQFQHEASLSASWRQCQGELMVSDQIAGTGLFYRQLPDFLRAISSAEELRRLLLAYGIPARTLRDLDWTSVEGDDLFRTLQGDFQIVTGRYAVDSIVDPAQVRLCRFDPITGIGYRYTSEYAYNQLIDSAGDREATVQALTTTIGDGLGHKVQFSPTDTQPYRSYALVNSSGRTLDLQLGHNCRYRDGDLPGAYVLFRTVTELVDSNHPGSTIKYLYDDHNRLVSVLLPGQAGSPARELAYSYDRAGNLTRIASAEGHAIHITYVADALDSDDQLLERLKVASIGDDEGNRVDYAYDHAGREVTVAFSGPSGRDQLLTYGYLVDEADTRERWLTEERVVVSRGFSGSQVVATGWRYSNDGRFRLTSATDPVGNTYNYEYNDFAQLSIVVDPSGHRREFEYDLADPAARRYDLVRASEENIGFDGHTFLVTRSYSWNRYSSSTSPFMADHDLSEHRIHTRINENGNSWSYAYDDGQETLPTQPTTITDPQGAQSTHQFDLSGNITSSTNAVGDQWRWSYNDRGQPESATDPNGYRQSRSYDEPTGWLISATDPLGNVSRYVWTADARLHEQVDPSGAVTAFEYYPSGRLRRVTGFAPHAITLTFSYTPAGNLSRLTDPLGRATIINYDEAGRAYEVARERAVSRSRRFVLDPAGRVVAFTDSNGATTRVSYDVLGRRRVVDEPDWQAGAPANPGKTVTAHYDRLGHTLRVADSEIGTEYLQHFDPAGNVIWTRDFLGEELTYTYDSCSRLIKLANATGALRLEFIRDPAGQIAEVVDSNYLDPAVTFTYIRSAKGFRANLYGIIARQIRLGSSFTYDAARRLTGATYRRQGAPWLSFQYAYRADGLIHGQSGTFHHAYTYDGLKRLDKQGELGLTNTYDDAGNRIRHAADPLGPESVYDADNRLLSDSSRRITCTYDENGNLLSATRTGAAVNYEYDGANRLSRVTTDKYEVRYTYDPSGRLIRRTLRTGDLAESTRYILADRTILYVMNEDGSVASLFTRDSSGRLLRVRAPGSAPGASSPNSLFAALDGLGSLTGLTDSDGVTRQVVDYQAWGESSVKALDIIPFGYRSGFKDPETGLLNFGARWYDPAEGRWLTQDPLMVRLLTEATDLLPYYKGLANLYIYADDNPVNRMDLTGLFGWGLGASGVAEVGLVYPGAGITGGAGLANFVDFSRPWYKMSTSALYASGGLFAQMLGGDHYNAPQMAPRGDPSGPGDLTTVLGAYTGISGDMFFTTASNADEFKGPAQVVSLNLPIVSFQISFGPHGGPIT